MLSALLESLGHNRTAGIAAFDLIKEEDWNGREITSKPSPDA
jgi:hypothetical protein